MINRIFGIVFIVTLSCPNALALDRTNAKRQDWIDFAGNLVVSEAVFTFVNGVLFRNQLMKGQVSPLMIAGISAIEVAENLANFVQIESLPSYVLPILELAVLVHLRAQMPQHMSRSSHWVFVAETAVAKFIKNKVNFMVTENWYPKRWLLK